MLDQEAGPLPAPGHHEGWARGGRGCVARQWGEVEREPAEQVSFAGAQNGGLSGREGRVAVQRATLFAQLPPRLW